MMRFEIGEDRAVVVIPSQGEIINAEHGWSADERLGKRTDETEQRHAACGPDAPLSEAHAGASTKGETEVREEGLQGYTPSRVASCELRGLLDEGAVGAGSGAAAEAANMETEEYRTPADGLVGDLAGVARVDVAGTAMARRAASSGSRWFDVKFECGITERDVKHA